MPSLIQLKESNDSKKERILSYCIEPAYEVLEKVFQNHKVLRYKNIVFPIDPRPSENYPGLIISDAKHPPGTIITAEIEDLDLNATRIDSPRTKWDYRDALREQFRGNWWRGFYGSNSRVPEEYRRDLEQLLEISKITLGTEKLDDLIGPLVLDTKYRILIIGKGYSYWI